MALNVGFLLIVLATGVFGENKVPSVGQQNVVHRYSDASSSLSPEHVFYPNSQTNFSWDDPELRRRLWSGQPETAPEGLMPTPTGNRTLRKRAVPRILGTLWDIPSCLGCAEARNEAEKGSIQMLTEEYLETVLIKSDMELVNSCLFYTSLMGTENLQNLGPWYSGSRAGHGLSLPATDFGCSNNLATIWTSFSGGTDTEAAGPDPKLWNYWCVEEAGSWLNDGLVKTQPFNYNDEPDVRQYFENMSGAYAKHCGGIVRVMTFEPENLGAYQRIWGMVELKRLQANINNPGLVKPTILIAIDATDPTKQYVLDFQTLAVIGTVDSNDPVYFDPSKLPRRDTCNQNINYQPQNEDWFG